MAKIGRNDPCPCKSGKKYKKCCLEKDETNLEKPSGEYFRLKGEKAEEIVHELATKSFLTDWCYKNPKLPDGNELCDLLVVFGEVVIIWQIKDLKINKYGKYQESKVKKNLRQLSGANKNLFDLKREITLENPRRGEEKFDTSKIKEVYLISALTGEEENFFSFFEEFKDKKIHVFNKEAVEIILNELDTIKDFIGYLREKEKLFAMDTRRFWGSGEKDLLAYYIIGGRSFDELMEADVIYLDEGFWEHLSKKPEYVKKQEENKISYIWDEIINRVHTSGEGYERFARELAKHHRFERRILGKAFFDAHVNAHNETKNNVFRRVIEVGGVTYCFMFSDDKKPREFRRELLKRTCFVARGLNKNNKKVIGIATEMKFNPTCSYDFCMIDIPDWGEDEQKQMEEIQKELGIFVNPTFISVHEDEYPKDK